MFVIIMRTREHGELKIGIPVGPFNQQWEAMTWLRSRGFVELFSGPSLHFRLGTFGSHEKEACVSELESPTGK